MYDLKLLEDVIVSNKNQFDEKLYAHLLAIIEVYRELLAFSSHNSTKDLIVDFSFCYWKGWQWRSFKVWDSARLIHYNGYNDIVAKLTFIFKDIQDVYLPVNPEKSNYDFNIYTKILDFNTLFNSLLDRNSKTFLDYIFLFNTISSNQDRDDTRTKI